MATNPCGTAADPLADIHNTQKIAGVMLDGKYRPKTDLDKMQFDAASALANVK